MTYTIIIKILYIILYNGYTRKYSEKKDMCDWTDRQKVISFINSDNPLSHCKDCPTPPYEKKYESNNLPIDLKNFSRGIKLINDYSKV